MRPIYIFQLAAVALLASTEAFLPAADSDETMISQLVSLDSMKSDDAVQNTAKSKRFLRTDKENDAEERTLGWKRSNDAAWANIFDIKRTKAETIDLLGAWLAKRVAISDVAKQLKIFSHNDDHKNWKALLEYTAMTHKKYTSEDMTLTQAQAYLKEMFEKAG